MAGMPCDLHMATSVEELDKQATDVRLNGDDVQTLWQEIDDTFNLAIEKDNEPDEEAAYLYYKRHMHIFEWTLKTQAYIRDKDHWDQYFNRDDLETSRVRSEVLADSLNQRYGEPVVTDRLREELKKRKKDSKDRRAPETDDDSSLSDNDSDFDDEPDGVATCEAILVKNLPPDVTEDALELYFVKERLSNGGTVEKVQLLEDGSAIVYFEDPQVATRVLKKKDHKIKRKDVQVEPYAPEEPAIDSECTIEVRGFGNLSEDLLELYFDDQKKSGGGDVEKVTLSEDGSVVLITFESSKAAERVLKRDHKIKNTALQVCAYKEADEAEEEQFDATCTVEVRNFGTIDDDVLQMYFEHTKKSGGGDIKEITRKDDIVYITFENEKVATRVVNREHSIRKQTLSVVPLNTAGAEQSQASENEQEYKTIRVKHAVGLSEDLLTLYFENTRKSGGGLTESVELRGNDVYITFQSAEDAEKAAAKDHALSGRILDVILWKNQEDDKIRAESFGELDVDSYSSDESDEADEVPVIKLADISRISEDTLTLYFENRRRSGGDDVEMFEKNPEDSSALIYFKDGDAAKRVLQKAPHRVDNVRLSVSAYTRTRPQSTSSWLRSLRKENTLEVKGCKDTNDEKVTLWFDNENRSGGSGLKSVRRSAENRDIVYVVFKDKAVAERVSQRSHAIGRNKLEVKLIKVGPKYDNRFLVTELNDRTQEQQLSDYLMTHTPCYPLVFLWGDENCAVLVTVDTSKAPLSIRDIQRACNRRPLGGAFLDISPVPISHCILVRGLDHDTDEDHLFLYFESPQSGNKARARVDKVELRSSQEALVYFEDYKVIEQILPNSHNVGSTPVQVSLYMECLQAATAPFQLPPVICMIDLDEYLVRFIRESPGKDEELASQLDNVHGALIWTSGISIEIECTLDQDMPEARRLAKSWEKTVRETFGSFVSQFLVLKEKVLDFLWANVRPRLEGIRKASSEVYLLQDGQIIVVGPRGDAESLMAKVKTILKDSEEESHKTDGEITESIRNLDPLIVRLLRDAKFDRDLSSRSSSLKVQFSRDLKEITFTGSLDDVKHAKDQTDAKARGITIDYTGNLPKALIEMACKDDVRRYILSKMSRQDLVASWESDGHRIKVSAFSDEDCHAALQSLKQMISRQKVSLKDEALLLVDTKQWHDLVDEQLGRKGNFVEITTDKENHMVEIFATDEEIITVTEEVNNFITENAVYSDFVQYSRGVQRFLSEREKVYIKSLNDLYRKYFVEVTEGVAKARFNIKGTKTGLNAVRSELDKMAERVEHLEQEFSNPGIAKLLQSDKGLNVIRRVEDYERCVIESDFNKNEATNYGRAMATDNVGAPEEKLATEIAPGVQLYVYQGDITALHVDAIVNAANQKLQHEGGLARIIADKGGDVVKKESEDIIKSVTDVMVGDAVVTRGGNLPCKWVIHAVGPVWSGGTQGEEDQLREAVFRSIEEADAKHVKSLAISALSTGIFNYPREAATRCIIQAIVDCLEENPDVSVEEIYACDQNQDTVNAFLRAVEEIGNKPVAATSGKRPVGGIRLPGAKEIAEGHSTFKIGNVKIVLKKGDITEEDSDCIVNCTNNDLNMDRGGVSRAVAKAGGKELEKELMGKGKEIQKKGYVITRGSGLQSAFVIHISVEFFNLNWKDVIKTCLKATKSTKDVKTLALPALGTGSYESSPEMIGTTIAEAVSESNKEHHIKELRVVVLDETHIDLFSRGISKACEKLKEGKTGLRTRVKNQLKGIRDRFTRKKDETVTLHFFSDGKHHIENAIVRIQQHYNDNRLVKEVDHKDLERLDAQQVEEIWKLKDAYSVNVDYQARLGKVRLQGVMMDVLAAVDAVYKIIQDVQQYKQLAEKAEMLSTYLQWAYVEDDSTTVEFDKISNQEIEKAFNSDLKTVRLKPAGLGEIEVDFDPMVWFQVSRPEKRFPVLRKGRISGGSFDPPSTWDQMNSESELVPVLPDSDEYKELEKKFYDSIGGRRNIMKIQRVQTKFLWQQYWAMKEQLGVQNPGHENEKFLWHGTTAEAYHSIAKSGFNRSYCGKNATAYGEGVYFASEAEYSAQSNYAKIDDRGQKHIFLARVLTGVFTKGRHGIRVPPVRSEFKHQLYDSVVDDPNKPTIFVIFNDTQAYPDYLISFA